MADIIGIANKVAPDNSYPHLLQALQINPHRVSLLLPVAFRIRGCCNGIDYYIINQSGTNVLLQRPPDDRPPCSHGFPHWVITLQT